MSAGNFSFVKKASNREYLEDAYKAMEGVDGSWKMLKGLSDSDFKKFVGLEGYPPMARVCEKILSDHSGTTFFWTFHKIRAIAVNGWDGFVEEYSGKI
jgi:hypothetical protein